MAVVASLHDEELAGTIGDGGRDAQGVSGYVGQTRFLLDQFRKWSI